MSPVYPRESLLLITEISLNSQKFFVSKEEVVIKPFYNIFLGWFLGTFMVFLISAEYAKY
jgi:hypothetical protein